MLDLYTIEEEFRSLEGCVSLLEYRSLDNLWSDPHPAADEWIRATPEQREVIRARLARKPPQTLAVSTLKSRTSASSKAEGMRRWRKANPEMDKSYKAKWRAASREHIRAYMRAYRLRMKDHPEVYAAYLADNMARMQKRRAMKEGKS